MKDKITPWMTDNELFLFEKYIKNSKKYFEFGTGGSTYFVYEKSKANIITVDSSKEWIKKIKKQVNSLRVKYLYVNIGKIGKLGRPENDLKKDNWYKYYNSIRRYKNIDTVFIDGRFRVNCALESLKKHPNATILIHDFRNREEYHILYDFLDEIDFCEKLSIFKIKDDININEINECIKKHKYDYL